MLPVFKCICVSHAVQHFHTLVTVFSLHLLQNPKLGCDPVSHCLSVNLLTISHSRNVLLKSLLQTVQKRKKKKGKERKEKVKFLHTMVIKLNSNWKLSFSNCLQTLFFASDCTSKPENCRTQLHFLWLILLFRYLYFIVQMFRQQKYLKGSNRHFIHTLITGSWRLQNQAENLLFQLPLLFLWTGNP